jgi:hypothetical protein
MRAFFGRQGKQPADQLALGKVTLFLESVQPDLSAHTWLLQALSPKLEARRGRADGHQNSHIAEGHFKCAFSQALEGA